MRSLFAATILAAILLTGAGCAGSDDSGDAGGTTTASPAPASSAADNTKQVCADIETANDDLKEKVIALVTRALQEAAAGDEAKSEQTMAEMKALIIQHGTKVQSLAATATNPELKQVLTTLAAELKKADAQAEDAAMEAADAAMEAAEAKYKSICGT